MDSENIKEWSILIYANGNNELEPEIANSKKLAETVGSNENVNVVMQIARESKNLVKTLRPFDNFEIDEDQWIGTRRYLVGKRNSKLLEKLNNINMANPKNLYDFIVWAVENFPAQHYMLILGGHGYQFVGCMTDYSGRLPYIMGFPEINNAIDLACEYCKIKFEYLFLDTCYANFIEVINEFGKKENHLVNYLITYIINGPLIGFPINKIISIIQENHYECNPKALLKIIIDNMTFDVVAIKIDYYILNSIKLLFNDLAKTYLSLNEKNQIDLAQIFNNKSDNMPYTEIVNSINTKMNSLIFGYKKCSNYNYPLVNIANKPAKDMYIIRLYNKLDFSKDNDWVKLLYNTNKKLLNEYNYFSALKPVVLTPKAVYAYIIIMNKSQDLNTKNKIFLDLIKYKGWEI